MSNPYTTDLGHPTPPPAKPNVLPPLDQYNAVLAAAQKIHGVSLWADAWRRLKLNRTAMIALGTLIALGVLALLTPVLPLQSPIRIELARQFQEPNLLPAEPLGLAALRVVPANETDSQRKEREKAYQQRLEGLFGDDLWVHDQFLVAVRVMLFGDYSVPSLCGTDALGRDLLARLFWGARMSLLVALVATFVSLVIGVSYGAISGYVGGWVDEVLMRIVDVLYSIPFIFLVIFLITILKAPEVSDYLEQFGINRITVFFLCIGALYWLTMARVVRGQIITLKQEQFVEAARVIGAGRMRIIFWHLVPNVLSVVIVYLTLTIPSVMLFEAFLSFLGLGVESPDVSWGLLANDGLQVITPIKTRWWLVLFPGLALAGTLFALNFLGDGLRDALDPRLKHK